MLDASFEYVPAKAQILLNDIQVGSREQTGPLSGDFLTNYYSKNEQFNQKPLTFQYSLFTIHF